MTPRRTSTLLTALTPAVCLLASPVVADAAPKTARVHIQAPVDISNPANTDLDKIENYGKAAIWSKSFEIPYSTLEPKIGRELKKILDKELPQGEQVEKCDDPCPDVTWEIKYTPSFKFTKKGAVQLKKIGRSADNKIQASVTFRVKAGLKGNLLAEADVPKPMPVGFIVTREEVDVPFNLFIEAEFTASMEATLWPNLSAKDVKLTGEIISTSPNIELNGEVAALGAQIGILLGNTPLGFAAGGPLAFSTLLAVIGDTAADIVEAKMKEEVEKAVEEQLNKGLSKAQAAVVSALNGAIGTANAKKNKALNTKLPGVNKSINELKSALGADLDLHTVTPANTIAASAVLRMSPSKGSAAMGGTLKVPARKCVYAEFKGAAVPVGFEAINTKLDAKVGQSCSSAMSGVSLAPYAYLGANPRTALGSTADNLPSWKSGMGDTAFTGTLTKNTGHFACSFAVSAMPNTAIMELRAAKGSSGLDMSNTRSRYLVRKVGSSTVVLDDRLKLESDAVEGGEYGCSTGGGPVLTPNRMQELKDLLDNCPSCGRRAQLGNSVILELKDVAALTNSSIGQLVTGKIKTHGRKLGRRGRARAATKARVRRKSTRAAKANKTNKARPTTRPTARPTTRSSSPTVRKSAGASKSKARSKAAAGR